MSGFFDNLFGAIAGNALTRQPSGIGFIPANTATQQNLTLAINGKDANWLGLRNKFTQKRAYEFCSPLAAVINRLAEYDTNGIVEIIRNKGKGADDFATNAWARAMNNRIAQPNPLQSWEQFRGQQVVYKKIFGYCPVLPIMPAGFENQPWECSAMINLPPWLFDAIATRKLIGQSRIEDIVKEYRCTIMGQTFVFSPDQLFILEDTFMQDETTDFLLPLSRLVSLDMDVSNFNYAKEADNVVLRQGGPRGFISHDPTTDPVSGYTPMMEEEKAELQADLAQYGMSWNQFQYLITRQSLRWNSMGYNVKEMGTKETIIASKQEICDAYGYPYVLLQQSETTFANGAQAEANVYQSNVIPGNIKDLNKYNKFFKAAEANCKISADFDHINALQEDKLAKSQSDRFHAMAQDIAYKDGIITLNEWRESIGMDSIDGGDSYYVAPVAPVAPGAIDPNADPNADPNNPDNTPVKK